MMRKEIIVFDLDGTISDDRWRRHLIPDYDSYHFYSPLDEPVNLHLWNFDQEKYSAIVITSRPEKYRAFTELWLNKHGFLWTEIFMRPDENVMTSPDLKKMLIEKVKGIYFNPKFKVAYDDRDDVLKAYQQVDVPTEKVSI